MNFKHGLVTAGCLAAIGMAGTAQAVQVAGEYLEVYGNLYPQFQESRFSGSVPTGTPTSNLTKGLVTPTNTTFAAQLDSKTQFTTVNSYVGLKGKKSFSDVTVGYDYQAVMQKNYDGNFPVPIFSDVRDAFAFVSHAKLGTLQLGQMDTIYKEFGDRVRMLGVSSSNFVSTSGVLSAASWKSIAKVGTTGVTEVAGTTSFNTRIGDQILWISPNWNGVEVGYSLRPDPNPKAGRNQSLSSMGARWSNKAYYVGLAQEIHNDYRTFSGTGYTGSATTLLNTNPSSKDTAVRLSFGYTAEKYRLGIDLASLKYTEDATALKKFSGYDTTTWQISGEYKINAKLTVAANYAQGAAGSCSISGGGACSTSGLGGNLVSLGARYDIAKAVGLFALYAENDANDSATYASSAIGGKVTNMAVGVQVKF